MASGSSAIGVSSGIETRALIRDALQKLPHRQRTVLVLRFYADLSEQQTAEVMQCSVAAVKSLATRATATLRKDIGEEAL
ncbi:MAG: sigma-70 family RNA polymerase sigma factor [Actinomycetota bacterium]